MLRREKTGETLLYAGGVWDRIERRFVKKTPSTVCVIDLVESQVDYTLWFAEFLRDFREGYPRDISAALVAGDRRAGKTFDVYFCQWAALFDVPLLPVTGKPAIGWTISKTYKERDELDQLVVTYLPPEWYRATKAPEHRYDLVHGSVLRNLSADDPDSLKQGAVDWLLYNEGQKMPARAVVNGLYGTADRAGLCMIACNKPSASDTRGEWLFDLREAISDEQVARSMGKKVEPLGIKFFGFSSKDNPKVDQPARRRVGRLAAVIDPSQAEADDADSALDWKRPGDKACWEFDKHRHLHAVPDVSPSMPEITNRVIKAAGFYDGEWAAAGGVDFQDRPHIVSSLWRCFGDPGRPIFWASGEFAGEKRWTEEEYLDEFEARFPALNKHNLAWVGDASGSWQDSAHSGKRTSFQVWKEKPYSYLILPPQDPKSDEPGARARNPFVDDQLQLVNELLRTDRLFIDPNACPWLAECFRQAVTKKVEGRRKIVQDRFAHALASALYVLWRLANAKRFREPGMTPRAESFRDGRIGSSFRF